MEPALVKAVSLYMDKTEKQNETVLVVDGDIITRTVIADYLRHCGYRVFEAHDALEAQQALQHQEFHVDIMLSDIDLPSGMSGFQLAGWVRQNQPDVKVLLSAAAERTASVAGDLCEEGPHLAKPYDAAIVVEHIKRLRGGK
jgi:CheY-like chemotaxis protein